MSPKDFIKQIKAYAPQTLEASGAQRNMARRYRTGRLALLADRRKNTLAFMGWRMRHGLSLTAAAEALGISRRTVAYYTSGEREAPKTKLLACRG